MVPLIHIAADYVRSHQIICTQIPNTRAAKSNDAQSTCFMRVHWKCPIYQEITFKINLINFFSPKSPSYKYYHRWLFWMDVTEIWHMFSSVCMRIKVALLHYTAAILPIEPLCYTHCAKTFVEKRQHWMNEKKTPSFHVYIIPSADYTSSQQKILCCW